MMIDRFLALIILGMAVIFTVTAVVGLRRGFTRIPLDLIEFEEFDRSENKANFWGVTILNFGLAAACLVVLAYWLLNGMIE